MHIVHWFKKIIITPPPTTIQLTTIKLDCICEAVQKLLGQPLFHPTVHAYAIHCHMKVIDQDEK